MLGKRKSCECYTRLLYFSFLFFSYSLEEKLPDEIIYHGNAKYIVEQEERQIFWGKWIEREEKLKEKQLTRQKEKEKRIYGKWLKQIFKKAQRELEKDLEFKRKEKRRLCFCLRVFICYNWYY